MCAYFSDLKKKNMLGNYFATISVASSMQVI